MLAIFDVASRPNYNKRPIHLAIAVIYSSNFLTSSMGFCIIKTLARVRKMDNKRVFCSILMAKITLQHFLFSKNRH